MFSFVANCCQPEAKKKKKKHTVIHKKNNKAHFRCKYVSIKKPSDSQGLLLGLVLVKKAGKKRICKAKTLSNTKYL